MDTSRIDNDKKNKQNYDNSISSFLSTCMASQFQASISKFQNATLSPTSPLHKLMSLGLERTADVIPSSQNLSNISTSYSPAPTQTPTQTCKDLPDVVEPVTESLASMQIKNQATPSKVNHAFQDIVSQASQKHGVPVALINAVIKQESNFNPQAKSPVGAQGLMQLMPATGKAYGCTDAFNPEQNIMAGTQFLSDLLTKYKGDVPLTLAGYNAGPGNVAKYGNAIPPFKETQNYVVKVGKYYQSNLAAMEQSTQKFVQNATEGSKGART